MTATAPRLLHDAANGVGAVAFARGDAEQAAAVGARRRDVRPLLERWLDAARRMPHRIREYHGHDVDANAEHQAELRRMVRGVRCLAKLTARMPDAAPDKWRNHAAMALFLARFSWDRWLRGDTRGMAGLVLDAGAAAKAPAALREWLDG